jgi:hypothetical protein
MLATCFPDTAPDFSDAAFLPTIESLPLPRGPGPSCRCFEKTADIVELILDDGACICKRAGSSATCSRSYQFCHCTPFDCTAADGYTLSARAHCRYPSRLPHMKPLTSLAHRMNGRICPSRSTARCVIRQKLTSMAFVPDPVLSLDSNRAERRRSRLSTDGARMAGIPKRFGSDVVKLVTKNSLFLCCQRSKSRRLRRWSWLRTPFRRPFLWRRGQDHGLECLSARRRAPRGDISAVPPSDCQCSSTSQSRSSSRVPRAAPALPSSRWAAHAITTLIPSPVQACLTFACADEARDTNKVTSFFEVPP